MRLLGRDAQALLQDVVEDEERRLRAGLEAEGARGDHDVLQEHAVVEPRALLQVAVDGEDQPDRRVEEQEVAPRAGRASCPCPRGRCRACRRGPSRRRAGGRGRARAISPDSSCIPRSADLAAVVARRRARVRISSRTAPSSTHTFQGCMLEPDGARPAMSRMRSISSRGTGLGRKARMQRRPVMASSTVIMGRGSMREWHARNERPMLRRGP